MPRLSLAIIISVMIPIWQPLFMNIHHSIYIHHSAVMSRDKIINNIQKELLLRPRLLFPTRPGKYMIKVFAYFKL